MSNAPRSPHARRNWGEDDTGADILHVDMDSFYAQVELKENPSLAGRPVIVAGSSARGVVTSATYEARALGIRAGMPTMQARSLCPNAHFVHSPMSLYRTYSARVMSIIAEYTPVVEQLSIDEAFMDVAGSHRRLGSSLHIARSLRERIRNEVGLPASVGISSVKSVAKIASAHAKPDGLLLIPQAATVDFLHSLPVGALWGVGAKTEKILRQRGIDTVAQLAHTPLNDLHRWIGAASAHHLHNLAWGIDPRNVAPRPVEKSIGTERTFERDIRNAQEIDAFLLEAAHDCARRLRKAQMVAWTVSIKIRDANRRTITRSATLSIPTDLGRTIAEHAQILFHAEGVPTAGVRLLGVRAESLQSRQDGVAVALDDDGRPRATEEAMDTIAQRFGRTALTPASLLGTTKLRTQVTPSQGEFQD
ncbi:DNA polymerase IV [Schaalia canis]|uniref:DNA polymerase IV n=1 Tax=Schaalia canis TaxID=100469 RepID=A0A3P1SHB9_9ACTO|nr:DNA polymerase IV [Schaalia canis]RRC96416.1 DNA polymerase IV [Schaalia canis]